MVWHVHRISTAFIIVIIVIIAYPVNQSSDPCNISTCYKASAPTKPSTTVTPTHLPVSSTPISQTTYAKDHEHASLITSKSGVNSTATVTANKAVNGTEPTAKSTGAAGNVTTSKPVKKCLLSMSVPWLKTRLLQIV